VRFVCGFLYLVGLDLPMRNYTTFMSGLCFPLLIAFPSPPFCVCVRCVCVCVCVGERENSLSQVKTTSVIASPTHSVGHDPPPCNCSCICIRIGAVSARLIEICPAL